MRMPKGDCPCGSGKAAVDCCYQSQPPLQRKPELQVNSIRLNASAQVVDALGLPLTRWLPAKAQGTLKIEDLFVIDDFIYQAVKRAYESIARRLPPFAKLDTPANENKVLFEQTLVHNLYRNLKAAHYHLQNFVFRFLYIAEGFSQKPVDVGAGLKVVDQDFPLEYEFESYMVRYRTAVELTVKLIALKAIGIDPRKKNQFDFKRTLEVVSKKCRTPSHQALANVIREYRGWLDEQRKIRNAITHDGANNVLRNFEHIRGKTLNATVLDRTADVMCLEMFRQLVAFVSKVLNALYEHKCPEEPDENC